ncbi:hypothetical protein ACFSC4_30435 [Deinococcus malanensis]|uniref:hypothetical protein n=1 Tax=Deinococcus malanensis TaxID=1706855 RepID=UPI0036364814
MFTCAEGDTTEHPLRFRFNPFHDALVDIAVMPGIIEQWPAAHVRRLTQQGRQVLGRVTDRPEECLTWTGGPGINASQQVPGLLGRVLPLRARAVGQARVLPAAAFPSACRAALQRHPQPRPGPHP